LKMGANANRGVRQNGEDQRGCTLEQFNKQHPLSLKDCQMRLLQKIGFTNGEANGSHVLYGQQMVRYATFKMTTKAER
jgi:predicted RNA binding protein YcfA (HicA-like mRNA interferase family)